MLFDICSKTDSYPSAAAPAPVCDPPVRAVRRSVSPPNPLAPARPPSRTRLQLFCPIDIAHATVESLGRLERVQFKDVSIPCPATSSPDPDPDMPLSARQLNPDVNPFQRTYVSQIRRCDEAERRLRFLTQQIASQEIHIRPFEETSALIANMSGPQALEELDSRLSESEQRVVAMNTSYENLEKRALELEEARQVLRETERFFHEAQGRSRTIRTSFEEEEHESLLDNVEAAGLSAGEGGLGGGGFELECVSPARVSL